MRCLSACLLTFAALTLGPWALPGHAQAAAGSSPAWKLLAEAERSLNRIADAAHKSPVGLRAGSPQYAPFWDAMEEMDRALGEVEGSLGKRNQQLFQALRSGSRALAQLRVVWPRTGVQDPAVALGLESLGSSYRQLRTKFGPEQLRYQQGRELSAREREHFRELQRAQLRFIALLQPLRFQAEKRGDRTMVAHLDRILDQAEKIVDANPTLDEYLDASMTEDEIIGEWDGNAAYAEPTYKTAWHQADAAVEELYVSAEAGFVFSLNLGDPEPGAPAPGPEGSPQGEAQAQMGSQPDTQTATAAPAPGITVFQPTGELPAPEPEAETAPETETAPEAPSIVGGDPAFQTPAIPEATEADPTQTEDAAVEAAATPEPGHEIIEEGTPEESYDISEEDLPVAETRSETQSETQSEAVKGEATATVEPTTPEAGEALEAETLPNAEKNAEKKIEKKTEKKPEGETKAAPSRPKKPAKPPAKSSATKATKKSKTGKH